MLPACIEYFKTWCFSFQKQWTHWFYNPLFFWVKRYIPVFIGHFASAEMAFGCGYYDKQRIIGVWCFWTNIQPSFMRKINQILHCHLLHVQWSMVLKVNIFINFSCVVIKTHSILLCNFIGCFSACVSLPKKAFFVNHFRLTWDHNTVFD